MDRSAKSSCASYKSIGLCESETHYVRQGSQISLASDELMGWPWTRPEPFEFETPSTRQSTCTIFGWSESIHLRDIPVGSDGLRLRLRI